MTDAVVVGGGVAGLVAARDLAKAGAHVVLLEASDTLGGMVRSHVVGGIELDMAAESFATRTDAVRDLAIELGLGNDVVTPEPLGSWVMTRDGRAAPMPATGFLGIPGTPLAADVIAVVGRNAALRAQLDSLLPSPVGARAQSLGALVRTRMGAGVLEDLVVPVVAGVHSTHPDDLDPDRVAPGLRAALQREGTLARAVLALRARSVAGSAVAGIRGGIARLVRELVADMDTYGVAVRTGVRATTIDRAAVEVAGPEGAERFVADLVFSTVPDPAREAGPARAGIELVTLVVDQPALDDAPRGTGMLVHPDAPVSAKAVTHATAKWRWLAEAADGRHVLRLSTTVPAGSASGPVGVSVPLDPAGPVAQQALADARTLLGVPLDAAALLAAARVRWSGPDPAPAGLSDGVVGIGEASRGRGLAGIVEATRSAVAEAVSPL